MEDTNTEIMWAITGNHGLYTGTFLLRKDAISLHIKDIGMTWKQCRAKGDRAIKVTVSPLENNKYAR